MLNNIILQMEIYIKPQVIRNAQTNGWIWSNDQLVLITFSFLMNFF